MAKIMSDDDYINATMGLCEADPSDQPYQYQYGRLPDGRSTVRKKNIFGETELWLGDTLVFRGYLASRAAAALRAFLA